MAFLRPRVIVELRHSRVVASVVLDRHAHDVVAAQLPDELGMVARNVRFDLRDELVLVGGLDDLAALAIDSHAHCSSSVLVTERVWAACHVPTLAQPWRRGRFRDVRETRIQLCGPFAARIAGERVDDRLPGRQGRLLFAYLVLERRTVATRYALIDLLWGEAPPDAADAALSALLSKLRRIVGLEGRSDVHIALPADAWVDVEAAAEALHRAESCVARAEWASAWGPARVAQHVSERPFLPGETGLWAAAHRHALEAMRIRALELAGVAAMGIGGGELATAERTAERLVELAPLRESGTRLLMEIHAARGNRAEALLAYEALRQRLRDEIGVGPSAETVEAHRRLLA